MNRAKILSTLAALDETTAKGEKLLSSMAGDIDRIGRRSAGASSQALVATLGTGCGAAGALLLTLATGVPFVIVGPILATVGGAFGALGWRGIRGMRLERELQLREMVLGTIRKQIEALPPDAPQEVSNDLWLEYRKVATGYGQDSINTLKPGATTPTLNPGATTPGLLKKSRRKIQLEDED